MIGRQGKDVPRTVDQQRIAAAVAEIVEALGEDPEREGLRRTPSRVAAMYAELFAGLQEDPATIIGRGFEEAHGEMVVARDISFFSMCEHHFLPFFGLVHVGYIPDGRIVGISKLARLTDTFARRPQLQERFTAQIADSLAAGVEPLGVAVVVEAEHLCMMMRGARKPGSKIITSVSRGAFRTDRDKRAEFLSHIGGSER